VSFKKTVCTHPTLNCFEAPLDINVKIEKNASLIVKSYSYKTKKPPYKAAGQCMAKKSSSRPTYIQNLGMLIT